MFVSYDKDIELEIMYALLSLLKKYWKDDSEILKRIHAIEDELNIIKELHTSLNK